MGAVDIPHVSSLVNASPVDSHPLTFDPIEQTCSGSFFLKTDSTSVLLYPESAFSLVRVSNKVLLIHVNTLSGDASMTYLVNRLNKARNKGTLRWFTLNLGIYLYYTQKTQHPKCAFFLAFAQNWESVFFTEPIFAVSRCPTVTTASPSLFNLSKFFLWKFAKIISWPKNIKML